MCSFISPLISITDTNKIELAVQYVEFFQNHVLYLAELTTLQPCVTDVTTTTTVPSWYGILAEKLLVAILAKKSSTFYGIFHYRVCGSR